MSEGNRGREHATSSDSVTLGYVIGPVYVEFIFWYIVQIAIVVGLCLGDPPLVESASPVYRDFFWVVGLAAVVLVAAIGLRFFVFRLQQTVRQAQTEYRDLCRTIVAEVRGGLLETVQEEIASFGALHRNDRIRLELALEHLSKTTSRG